MLRTRGEFENDLTNITIAAPGLVYVDDLTTHDIDGDGIVEIVSLGGSFPGRSDNVPRPGFVLWELDADPRLEVLPGHAAVHPSDYEFVDVNGDGQTDLFIAAHGWDDEVAVGERNFLYLQSNGRFINANGNIPATIDFAHGAGAGDVDGDGDIDLVVNAQYGNNKTSPYLLINNGAGSFTASTSGMPLSSRGTETYTHERYHWVGLADVNGDGLADLITGKEREFFNSTSSSVFLNIEGGFSDSRRVELPPHPDFGYNSALTEIIDADIDGDGDLDLVTIAHSAEPYGGNWGLQILVNDGSGQFSDQTRASTTGQISGDAIWMAQLSIRDVNGDGLADIVVDNYQGGAVPLNTPVAWLGDGTGHFTELPLSAVATANDDWLLGYSTVIWDGDEMKFISLGGDNGSLEVWEKAASSIPQLEFNGRDRGDIYHDLGANERIDGGGGIDTFVIHDTRASRDVTLSASQVVITAADQEDRLSNFERLSFTDGALAFDIEGNAGQAYRLYRAAFERTPDTEGLSYWIGRLDSGTTTLNAIADSFIHSPEFVRTYGTTETVNNSTFVELLYLHTLGRDYDSEGFQYWVDRLDHDQTNRGDLLAFFSESIENKEGTAGETADGIWFL